MEQDDKRTGKFQEAAEGLTDEQVAQDEILRARFGSAYRRVPLQLAPMPEGTLKTLEALAREELDAALKGSLRYC